MIMLIEPKKMTIQHTVVCLWFTFFKARFSTFLMLACVPCHSPVDSVRHVHFLN